jgi:hypothetical protein
MLVVLELKTKLTNHLKTNDNTCRRMCMKQNAVTTLKQTDIIVVIIFVI